ncbi:MAG: PGPGW domain-containing protein [Actinomycetota bacterium]|nr:PGPGW domain-containing protein [Actinomycetota bacterium]
MGPSAEPDRDRARSDGDLPQDRAGPGGRDGSPPGEPPDHPERIGEAIEGRHRAREVAGFVARNGRRVAVAVVGFLVLLAGAVLSLPLVPGPGLVVMIVGLAILATEFAWARRTLDRAREKARQASRRIRHRRPGTSGPGDGGGERPGDRRPGEPGTSP